MAGGHHDDEGESAEPRNLWRTLGAIEANLKTVLRSQGEDRLASAQWRTGLRGEMQALRETAADVKSEVSGLKTQVASQQSEIANMKPEVRDWSIWRERTKGAGMLMRALWIAAAGGIGAIAATLMQWMLGGPRHP